MSIDAKIVDGRGGSYKACITHRGELVVNRPGYSTAVAVTASDINTAYNFFGPISDKQFVITDILMYADRGVGANDASIVVYEADGPDTTTEFKVIIEADIVKQTSRDILGLNLIVTAGKWINIKTNDDIVYATVMGFYVKED